MTVIPPGIIGPRWTFSVHALERMSEMGVEKCAVLDALAMPETDYPGALHHPPGRRVATRGELAVVYRPADRIVHTVLFNRREGR